MTLSCGQGMITEAIDHQQLVMRSEQTLVRVVRLRATILCVNVLKAKTIPGGKSRDEYIGIMNNLGLPLPEKIMEALQLNISAVEDTQMKLPTISELIEIHQLEAQKVVPRP